MLIVMLMVIPFFFAFLYGGLYLAIARSLRRMRDPILTLTPMGIIVNSQMTKIGLLRWHEIAEIRPYTLIYRLIGIVPHDVGAVARRIGGASAILLLLNAGASLFISLSASLSHPST